jgi:hypothetical protein
MKNYFLIFFDHEGYADDEEIVQKTIDELYSGHFRNRALKISHNVLLIKAQYSSDIDQPASYVSIALFHQKHAAFNHFDRIKHFVLPVSLENIEDHLITFKNEIEYLESNQKFEY